MNFAEELQKEQDLQYKEWVSKHENRIKSYTKSCIRQYGYADVYCHGHCEETKFGPGMGTLLMNEEHFLTRWLREQGFMYRNGSNSHGARTIEWRLQQ